MKALPKFLIVITGPTASGKSGLAVQLAKHLNTEIISADSRQLYREMNIGTAKISEEEMKGVPHHFISSHSIENTYNAALFENEALEIIHNIHKKNDFAVMAGGTGLYIDAVCRGINDQLPESDETIRKEIDRYCSENGIEGLFQLYQQLDAEGAAQIDAKNKERLIRATSACIQLGLPFSEVKVSEPKHRDFQVLYFVLDIPREELYNKINERVDQMIDMGLLDEVRSLLPHAELSALRTVGYSEIFDHLNGNTSLSEAIELIKRNTRRYAKRQLTWFRKYEDAHWIKPNDLEGLKSILEAEIYR